MFDFGFSEMAVIGLVALVVLGPERLPKVARQAGQWLGKLQRYVADVKSDINRQMELEELRNLQKEVTEVARDMEKSFQSTVSETRAELNSIKSSVEGTASSSTSSSAVTSDASTPTTAVQSEPQTDWDRIYALRRTRERLRERRLERDKTVGAKRPGKR